MTMRMLPSANPAFTAFASAGATKRDSSWISMPKPWKRCLESLQMLAHQDRRRRGDRDLPAGKDRRSRCTQRDFGLAEADIAADQPVCLSPRCEVPQHLGDGARLVLSLQIGEACGEALVF